MWLACHTGVEIAEANNLSEKEVGKIVSDLSAELPKGQKADSEHATDFTPPIYNIWKQQEKTNGSSHFGNSEVRWVDNLLNLYTKPFDMVLDPFAGGGSTIDICKRRFRRKMFSDHKPIVEREKEIRQHDLIDTGSQMQAQYSNDTTVLTSHLPSLQRIWIGLRSVSQHCHGVRRLWDLILPCLLACPGVAAAACLPAIIICWRFFWHPSGNVDTPPT
jgi:hypothetical protein